MQMTFIDAKRNQNALAITLSRNVLREKIISTIFPIVLTRLNVICVFGSEGRMK